MTIFLQNFYSLYSAERKVDSTDQLLEGLHAPRRLEWLPFDSIDKNNLEGLGRFTFDQISIDDWMIRSVRASRSNACSILMVE